MLTIEGSGITLTTPTTGTVTHTINANVGVAATQVWTVNPSATLTVGGNVTDFGGGYTLSKKGSGTLNLSGTTAVGSLYVGFNVPSTAGSVVVGSGGSLSVGYGSSSMLLVGVNGWSGGANQGTLDVSAGNFTANVGNCFVGVCAQNLTNAATGSGSLYLGNSSITATNFVIGGVEPDGNSGANNGGWVTVASGTTATILTPVMAIGTTKADSGGGNFTLLGTGATLNLGTNSLRTALTIGRHDGSPTGKVSSGIMDLSAGIANLYLSKLYLGYDVLPTASGGSTVSGTLTLGSNAANNLNLSGAGNVVRLAYTDSTTTAGDTVNGTLTIGNLGSTSSITSTDNSTAILVAQKFGTTVPTGTLNFNGGTLTITTTGSAIAGGGGTSNLVLGNTTGNGTGMTLKAGASSGSWITGLTSAKIMATGVTFDSNGYDITIDQALLTHATSTGGGLTKTGAGTLRLSGANTYTGATTVSNGILNLGVAEIAGTSGPLGKSVASNPGSIVLSGGTLQYSAANQNDYSGRFSAATGQQYKVDTNGQSVTWASALNSSGGTLTKAGAGTLTLTNTNAYTGATTVDAGTLALGASATLATSGVEVAVGAVFNTVDQPTYAIPTTKPLTLHLSAVGPGSAGKITAAGLDIRDADVVLTVDGDALDDDAYVLADYATGSLTGTFFHSVTALDGYAIDYNYNGGTQIALVAGIPGDFAHWAHTNITLIDEFADASTTGDPDGDGSNNLTEFAFAGNPLSGSDKPKVFSTVADPRSSGNELVLIVAVLNDAPDFVLDGSGLSLSATSVSGAITYSIQGSDNLVFPGIKVAEVNDQSTPEMRALLSEGSLYGYRSFVLDAGGLAGKGFLRAVVVKP
jgi:autotransporter-associated beta strand protein